MAENKLTLLESVELVGEGVSIPDLSPEDLVIRPQAGVADYTLVDAINSGNRWRERFKAQCDGVVEKHKDVLDFEEEDRLKGNKPVVAEKPVHIENQRLTEGSHAKVAKPEGDRIKAYNNALKYAKKDNAPYCYGYTNSRLSGKFFAFDQPFRWDGDDKAFRSQYKNTGVIYVAYPDKNFVDEELEESLVKAPALGLDEITPFFEMCDRLGIETLGDFERFMREYGRDKDPITALKDYFIDELEDLDFRAKKKSLTESVSDGWPESLQEFDFFQTIDRLAYEIRSAYRGAYTKAETYEELADYLENNVAAELEYVIDYLRNEAEDVGPLEESIGVSSEGSLDGELEAGGAGVEQLSPVVKVDLSKFKPWGNAVESYREIQEADKLYDLEKLLEKEWPEGIEDAALNDLLTDKDFLSAALDMQFRPEEN